MNIQVKIFDKDQSISMTEIRKLYTTYDKSVEEFQKIVSEIENGESKRSQSEISEELAAHKKTLSDAQNLSSALKDYLSEKTGPPADSLFDDVFESSTISLNLDNKHSEELKDTDNQLVRSVTNITFLIIGLEVLIVIIALSTMFFKIINPLKKLVKVVEDISSGDIDVKIPADLKKSKDEIGELANVLDKLLQSSHTAFKTLVESKVTEGVNAKQLFKAGLIKNKK